MSSNDEEIEGVLEYNEDITEDTPILDSNQYLENHPQKMTCYVCLLAVVAALGGFLFGYDTGVISGAMIPLKKKWDLSIELQEVVVSITIGGAIIGSLKSALMNEYFGRRMTLLVASLVFTVGSIMMALSNGVVLLIMGRFIVGLAIGYASMTVPIYIAEAAPTHIRGQLILTNTLFITLGQFLASIINGGFSYIKNDSWRFMLGFASIPSFAMFVGFLFLPESPRWLIRKGRKTKAREVLYKLRGSDYVEKELNEIELANEKSEADNSASLLGVLKSSSTRKALIVGCSLQMFQQLAAINTVMYYSATIIEMTGINDESTIIWLAAAVSAGNFIFSILSLVLVERAGRRKLLLWSMIGVILALLLLAATFYLLQTESPKTNFEAPKKFTGHCKNYKECFSCIQEQSCGFCFTKTLSGKIANATCLLTDKKDKTIPKFCNNTMQSSGMVTWEDNICPSNYLWLPVIGMIFYLAMFAPGMGSMPWTINAEIYPLWARSIGMSLSTSTNWIFNLIISLTFLNLIHAINMYGAFLFYAACTIVGAIFLFFKLPETKGKKLEEIEELFSSKDARCIQVNS